MLASLPGREAHKLPRLEPLLPAEATTIPWQALKLPNEAMQLPRQAKKLPPAAMELPMQALKLPTKATELPWQAMKLPLEATELPRQAVKLPDSVKSRKKGRGKGRHRFLSAACRRPTISIRRNPSMVPPYAGFVFHSAQYAASRSHPTNASYRVSSAWAKINCNPEGCQPLAGG